VKDDRLYNVTLFDLEAVAWLVNVGVKSVYTRSCVLRCHERNYSVQYRSTVNASIIWFCICSDSGLVDACLISQNIFIHVLVPQYRIWCL